MSPGLERPQTFSSSASMFYIRVLTLHPPVVQQGRMAPGGPYEALVETKVMDLLSTGSSVGMFPHLSAVFCVFGTI